MMQARATIGVVFALGLLAGCGDDDGPQDAGPPPVDQCLNPNDVAIARMTQSGDAGIGLDNDAGILSIGDYYAACAVSDCLPEVLAEDMEALDACMVTCTEATPATGLTPGCRTCIEELVICAGKGCAPVCILDETSQECHDCYEDICFPAARSCSGLQVL